MAYTSKFQIKNALVQYCHEILRSSKIPYQHWGLKKEGWDMWHIESLQNGGFSRDSMRLRLQILSLLITKSPLNYVMNSAGPTWRIYRYQKALQLKYCTVSWEKPKKFRKARRARVSIQPHLFNRTINASYIFTAHWFY